MQSFTLEYCYMMNCSYPKRFHFDYDSMLFFCFSVGMISTIVLIYKENGVFRGLYRGMSINYLRAIPMVAVSFSTYELLKQMLDLDTGMKL